jgi:adenylate cyclase
VLLAALSFALAVSPDPVERFRFAVFDAYQRLFPLPRTNSPVVIVGIDEPALRELGQWPWPRTRMAELIRRLEEGKAGSIGLDIFFPEPDRFSPASAANFPGIPTDVAKWLMSLPTNDFVLSQAIAASTVVLGVQVDEDDPDPRFARPPPRSDPVRFFAERELPIRRYRDHTGNLAIFDEAARSRGLINSGSAASVVRRAPLIARLGDAYYGSLGLESLRALTGGKRTIRDLGQGLIEIDIDGYKAIAQDDGTAWIRFGRHDNARFVSALDVMLGKLDPDTFDGRVVLVGITGLGLLDYKITPLGEQVPGVEIHAQVIENLFNGVSLTRYRFAGRIEALALMVLGMVFVFFVPRLRALRGLSLVLVAVVLLLVAGLVAFRYFNTLFDPVLPAVGLILVFVMVLVGALSISERQRRMLREQAARLAGELDAARRIQMGLLPDPKAVFEDERRVNVAALLEPARTVGGDFYDCFMIGNRGIFFVVADVSGKGLPAALFMASVKSHLKSAALRGGDVGTVLTRAQEEIARENPELLFVTAFAGLLNLETGELEFANAGHEPPYARTPNGVPERLGHAGGPPLCVMEEWVYPTWKRQMVPGEWLCVVTDGATEAMNPRREFFGSERLRTSLGWIPADASPEVLIAKLRDDVRRFAEDAEAPDDLTLLALRWEGARA